MPKLRHIAITVPDLEEAATFYEETFGMTRSMISPIAILLTDGVMSLAILKFQTDQQAGDERGKDFHGLHHMGFVR